ncbi:hypothetical protein CC117_15235 [Parafrankia colletiae]|uniref:Uncharacterized protein n=1 Tax=Parafrankia colletiae TaxID=573497 RepID=A0A1S1QYG3_9ACTN|nr:hypothetical protein CC117_15235 [Parafrankia colletiae]
MRQRSHGAGHGYVENPTWRQVCEVRSTATHNGHLFVQAKLCHNFAEKPAPSVHRFEQGHPQVRPGERQGDTRQTRATADVHHLGRAPGGAGGIRRCRGDGLGEHRAVEEMALPQPARLTGTDQATFDAGSRQQLRVPDRKRQARTEDGGRGRRNRPDSTDLTAAAGDVVGAGDAVETVGAVRATGALWSVGAILTGHWQAAVRLCRARSTSAAGW